MMEMMVTTGAKDVQSYSQLVTNVTANQCQTFLQAGCPSCHPSDSVIALKEESITFHRLANLKVPYGFWGCKNRPAPFPGWMS